MSDSYKVYASKDYVDNKITGMQVAAETLEPGSEATAEWNGEAGLLTLGVLSVSMCCKLYEGRWLEG